MKKNGLLIGLILLIVIVFSLLLFLTQKTPLKPTNVTVYFTPPTPTPIPETLNASDLFNATTYPTATPVETESGSEESADPIRSKTPIHQLRVQDAMGVPIAGGTISLGTESMAFKDGLFVIPHSLSGDVSVEIAAEGYAPIHQKISFATESIQTVVMEYTLNFKIRVFEADGKTPCPDAAVRLWKADEPPRPIADRCEISINTSYDGGPQFDSAKLSLKDGECRFTASFQPSNPALTTLAPFGISLPKPGDLVGSIGACAWFDNFLPCRLPELERRFRYIPTRSIQSKRLKIWDALCLSRQRVTQPMSERRDIFNLIRGDLQGFYFFGFPERPADLDVDREEISDARGECEFGGLAPALYYVQALKDDGTSEVFPLHTACGGAKSIVTNQSDVTVYVRREGLKHKYKLYTNVEDAEVILTPLAKNAGFRTDSTGQHGDARFEKVQYGAYRLRVKPSTDVSNAPIEREVRVDSPIERFNVSIPDWKRYSISGVVLNKQTREPIPGYELVLYNKYMLDYNVCVSGAQGKFIFRDVPPESYDLTVNLLESGVDDLKYLPHNNAQIALFVAYNNPGSRTMPPALSIVLEDRDIENVELLAAELVETRFSGKVVDKNEAPVQGASLAVAYSFPVDPDRKTRIKTKPAEAKTNERGEFSLSVLSGDRDDSDFIFEISAMEGHISPARWEPDEKDPEMRHFVYERFTADKSGSVTRNGRRGDRFEDLLIVIDRENDRAVHGQLIADEKDFSSFFMTAYQNSSSLKVKKHIDGSFDIDNVAQGKFTLNLSSSVRQTVLTPNGGQSFQKYITETIELVMPEDRKNMYVDITPRIAGYLWGHVLGSDGTPESGVYLEPKSPNDPSTYFGGAVTDKNGFFFIGGPLSTTEPYIIHCFDPYNHQERFRTKQITPNRGEIEIRLPE